MVALNVDEGRASSTPTPSSVFVLFTGVCGTTHATSCISTTILTAVVSIIITALLAAVISVLVVWYRHSITDSVPSAVRKGQAMHEETHDDDMTDPTYAEVEGTKEEGAFELQDNEAYATHQM